jgi:hypothetical protein
VYNNLLTAPPMPGDPVADVRNRELFNMIVKATYLGSALHIMKSCPVDNSHFVIIALQDWYGSANTSRTIIKHYHQKMEPLTLDKSSIATVYINNFIICCQKLEAKKRETRLRQRDTNFWRRLWMKTMMFLSTTQGGRHKDI